MKILRKIIKRIRWFLLVELREYVNPLFSSRRRSKLKGTDFCILSNNCWGGHVYRFFGLPYQSPTIGLYFYPEEYLRFINNYRYYLSLPLDFLESYRCSKYAKELEEKGETSCPIGKLGDVELVFLHYRTKEEAIEKWNRRVKKINYDRVLIKNSYQNGMSDEQVSRFDNLEHNNKFIFVSSVYPACDSVVLYRAYEGKGQIMDDVSYFRKYIDLYELINKLYI